MDLSNHGGVGGLVHPMIVMKIKVEIMMTMIVISTPANLNLFVFLATSLLEITMYAIDMRKNRFITLFKWCKVV